MNQILQAGIFSDLPKWISITYHGAVTPKLLKFEVSDETTTSSLYLSSIISAEEKLSWQSFQDLLGHASTLAQNSMQGLFGLDILSADIRHGIRNFNASDYSHLLINHARTLGPNGKTLVRFGQLFALLHKRAPADWGKIEIMTHVEIIHPERTKKINYFKKMIRESGSPFSASYLVHDMSIHPLWNPEEPTGNLPYEIYFFTSSSR